MNFLEYFIFWAGFVAIGWWISGKISSRGGYQHGYQPKSDAGPKSPPKTKLIKKVNSSDWDGDGSNGNSYH